MTCYAEYRMYGHDCPSKGDKLARFDTNQERDAWCKILNSDGASGGVWVKVSDERASQRFSLSDFDTNPALGKRVFLTPRKRESCGVWAISPPLAKGGPSNPAFVIL